MAGKPKKRFDGAFPNGALNLFSMTLRQMEAHVDLDKRQSTILDNLAVDEAYVTKASFVIRRIC